MLKTLKIPTSDLCIGMYISGLDRPWLETPFITQGFLIERPEDIRDLQKYCESVYIDSRRSALPGTVVRRESTPLARPAEPPKRPRPQQDADQGSAKKLRDRPRIPLSHIFLGRTLKAYRDDSAWEEEQPRAQRMLNTLIGDIDDIFENVSAGAKLDVIKLRKSVEPLVDSISRNPDACLWVSRLKDHDQYTYHHALSAAMWAVSLGRQLGLPRRDLRSLAMGCMLMDIGMLRVDRSLLQAERKLTEEETAAVAQHVNHGLDILKECGILNKDVIDIVAHHHERFDGSGYPAGLSRDQIPPFARIAAIVDSYDAITSTRSYAKPISPSDAIKFLYGLRDQDFQAELVEAFIQAVGIYPAGTLVELSSGEVGVVVAEYRTRRLRPKVMLLLDEQKNRLPTAQVIDLQEFAAASGGAPLTIKTSLEPLAYGLDLARVSGL
ncbi:Cyclic di-GMP phosphodiesterase [Halioglobus japonicus]|nr:Cyclic di-GMP phosphodiesterase [Halioglobus japonicus]